MATYDEHLQYLQEPIRFPKQNRREITNPREQISASEHNRIVEMLSMITLGSEGGGGAFKRYSMRDYLNLVYEEKIVDTFYMIYKDDALYRVYLGKTLIMKKKSEGEEVSYGVGFPLVFPIIFP